MEIDLGGVSYPLCAFLRITSSEFLLCVYVNYPGATMSPELSNHKQVAC